MPDTIEIEYSIKHLQEVISIQQQQIDALIASISAHTDSIRILHEWLKMESSRKDSIGE